MGARGRKSARDLALLAENNPVLSLHRPPPPSDLTDEQADEWRKIVDSEPADWFSKASLPILSQLCRHISRARRVDQLLRNAEASETLDVKEYLDLLRAEDAESRIIATLATKLRITQQSTFGADKAKPKGGSVRPWAIEGGAIADGE